MSTPRKDAQTKRVEIIFRIDVPSKGFDMRKLSDKVVKFYAEADRRIGGHTNLLTIKEIAKR